MPRSRAARWIVLVPIAIVCVLLPLSTSSSTAFQGTVLRVSFIDVGQGDSALLQTSDGVNVLIDGGPGAAGPTVVAYLQNQGVDTIDIVVMSHGHEDHIGGLVDLFQAAIPVQAVVYNSQPCHTTVCQDVWTEMQVRGLTPTPAVAGQIYTWGGIAAAVANPQPTPRGDQNEDSVVLRVGYGQEYFLFTGALVQSPRARCWSRGYRWPPRAPISWRKALPAAPYSAGTACAPARPQAA